MMRVSSILHAILIIGAVITCRAQQPGGSATATKRVLVEMYTGAWCGPCVTNADKANELRRLYGERVIPVSIHVSHDAMVVPVGDSIAALFGVGAIPAELADRARGVQSMPSEPATVGISVDHTYDAATRMVSATVKVQFLEETTPGDMRLNLFVVEDSVTGSGYGYDQLNYYNTTPSSPYYGKGDHVVGYAHRNVLRAVPSGAVGTTGIIPTAPEVGSAYEHTYQYNLPETHKAERTRLVAFLSYTPVWPPPVQGGVLNATEVPLVASTTGVPVEPASALLLSVEPMPINSEGRLRLTLHEREHITVELADMMGRHLRTVTREPMEAGEHAIPLDVADLPSGTYSLRVRIGSTVSSRTVIVTR